MMVLKRFFDFIFGFLVNSLPPRLSMLIISLIITLILTLMYKFFTNQQVMKGLKEEIKHLQSEAKKFKEDQKKAMDFMKRANLKNLEYTKHSLKPTLFTFIPLILIFGWLKATFGDYGDLFHWGFKIPLFGTGISWLGTYILSSIIFSIILRKLLKVY